jgi:hypothetical protein
VVVTLLVVAMFAAGAIDSSPSDAQSQVAVPLVRLKPADPEMRRLIGEGYGRSTSFRELVDALHRTNAIVTVQFGMCANGRFRSCVTNVAGDDRARIIRIKVNTRTTDNRLIATIAHELWHAMEILAEPSAIDPERVMALYRRIGIGACREGLSDRCETEAARALESRVEAELAR